MWCAGLTQGDARAEIKSEARDSGADYALERLLGSGGEPPHSGPAEAPYRSMGFSAAGDLQCSMGSIAFDGVERARRARGPPCGRGHGGSNRIANRLLLIRSPRMRFITASLFILVFLLPTEYRCSELVDLILILLRWVLSCRSNGVYSWAVIFLFIHYDWVLESLFCLGI